MSRRNPLATNILLEKIPSIEARLDAMSLGNSTEIFEELEKSLDLQSQRLDTLESKMANNSDLSTVKDQLKKVVETNVKLAKSNNELKKEVDNIQNKLLELMNDVASLSVPEQEESEEEDDES